MIHQCDSNGHEFGYQGIVRDENGKQFSASKCIHCGEFEYQPKECREECYC